MSIIKKTNLKGRIIWIDVLKYVCIMSVMLSHLEAETEYIRALYVPFFLNGFSFAAGYVYNHNRSFRVFFVKKVKGLFIPWLFFSVFTVLSAHIITFNEHGPLLEELMWNFLQIRALGDEMWYVAALFVAFIPFYFFISQYEKTGKKNTNLVLVVCFVLSFASQFYKEYMNPQLLPWGSTKLPWHIEYIFVAMFWMVFGYLFRQKCENGYYSIISTRTKIISNIVYLLMVYLPFLLNSNVDNGMCGIIYSYLCEFMGVFCLINISKCIRPNRHMLYIGWNTLLCFAFHGKILSILQATLKKNAGTFYAAILSNALSSTLFAILFTVVISYIIIIPIYVINRWFPFLIGRQYRQKKPEKRES